MKLLDQCGIAGRREEDCVSGRHHWGNLGELLFSFMHSWYFIYFENIIQENKEYTLPVLIHRVASYLSYVKTRFGIVNLSSSSYFVGSRRLHINNNRNTNCTYNVHKRIDLCWCTSSTLFGVCGPQ